MKTPITGGFPGLYRPGLIEATPEARLGRAAPQGFRGFTAPASLKRVINDAMRPLHFGGFPGLYRPGLIEAPPSARYSTASGRRVSGALPPRPH